MTNSSEKPAIRPFERHNARQMALQAVYEWQMTGNDPASIIQQFLDEGKKKIDNAYFSEVVEGVISHILTLDQAFQGFINNRTIDDLDQVDKAILRIATYEIIYHQELDYKIILNEAIELAKSYAAADSHRFVNGVLDKVVKDQGRKK